MAGLAPLLPFLMFGAVGFIMFGINSRANQQRFEQWRQAAHTLEFQLEPQKDRSAETRMSGRLNNMQVGVWTEVRGSGKNSSTHTVTEVIFGAAGPDVTLKKEGTWSRIVQFVGFKDIRIGDPRFDDAVVVKASTPEVAQQFLTTARRTAILSLFDIFPAAEVNGSRLRIDQVGRVSDAPKLVSTCRRAADIAVLISNPEPIEEALRLEAAGELAAGADALAGAFGDGSGTYVDLLEAEARVALGQREEAVEILERVEEQWPADPEVQGWKDVAAKPLPPIPPAIPTAQVSLEINDVIADLFASNRPSYEVEDRFAETYRGQTITWTGEVRKVTPFTRDRDFGAEPGTKATVTVGRLGDGRLVSDEIDAILGFPADAELTRELTVTFQGTLLRVDRFMRNLYIADARITD